MTHYDGVNSFYHTSGENQMKFNFNFNWRDSTIRQVIYFIPTVLIIIIIRTCVLPLEILNDIGKMLK